MDVLIHIELVAIFVAKVVVCCALFAELKEMDPLVTLCVYKFTAVFDL